MTRHIRELERAQLEEAMDLVWTVFSEFEAPDYSPEGIEEFRQYIQPEAMEGWQRENGLRLWVCREGGPVVGVIAMRPPAHVSLLFVDKAHHRQGIARKLYQTALRAFPAAQATVNSSPYALEAYRRLGFVDTGPEETVNGLRFIPMVHTR